jgi:putative endonuclease
VAGSRPPPLSRSRLYNRSLTAQVPEPAGKDAVAGFSAVGYDERLSESQGPVAQLGARLNGIQEVTGSIPVRSTILRSRELTPERELRLGKPCEGCRAIAAEPRRRAQTRRRLHGRSRPRRAETATLSKDSRESLAFWPNARRHFACRCPTVPRDKRFVYVLKNEDPVPQFYVGITSDVGARLSAHNNGRCPHTAMRRPWKLHVSIQFAGEGTALRFERYLKSGSGRAFAKRHFEA